MCDIEQNASNHQHIALSLLVTFCLMPTNTYIMDLSQIFTKDVGFRPLEES